MRFGVELYLGETALIVCVYALIKPCCVGNTILPWRWREKTYTKIFTSSSNITYSHMRRQELEVMVQGSYIVPSKCWLQFGL